MKRQNQKENTVTYVFSKALHDPIGNGFSCQREGRANGHPNGTRQSRPHHDGRTGRRRDIRVFLVGGRDRETTGVAKIYISRTRAAGQRPPKGKPGRVGRRDANKVARDIANDMPGGVNGINGDRNRIIGREADDIRRSGPARQGVGRVRLARQQDLQLGVRPVDQREIPLGGTGQIGLADLDPVFRTIEKYR